MKIVLSNCKLSTVVNPLSLVKTVGKNYVSFFNDRVEANLGYNLKVYKVIPGQQYKINAYLYTSGLCGISFWSKVIPSAVAGEDYYDDGYVSKDPNSQGGTSQTGANILTDYIITPNTEYVYLSWRKTDSEPTIEWVNPS